MQQHTFFDSPVGTIKIVAEGNTIIGITYDSLESENKPSDSSPILLEAVKQLEEYFNRSRKEFNLKLEWNGSEFQKKVWAEMMKIPYGRTTSYHEISKTLGDVNAVRAVGMACNRNPIAIVGPCHRVIGKNGDLTGYASGLQVKRNLLMIENPLVFGMQASLF